MIKNEKYISNVLDKKSRGWVEVVLYGLGQINLCYSTGVKILEKEKNKEIIKILDGPFKDCEGEISYKIYYCNDGISYIDNLNINKEKIVLKYSLSAQKLLVPTVGLFDAITVKNFLLKGEYFIRIPVFPHIVRTANEYLDENKYGSRFAETWFEIIPVSKKIKKRGIFLHFGKKTLGCLTVIKNQQKELNWTKLYFYLIENRIDYENVATIIIVD